jgi:multiple antibiotic resistance protein
MSQGPEHAEGLVGGPSPNELWPGDERRPCTRFGDRRHHSQRARKSHRDGQVGLDPGPVAIHDDGMAGLLTKFLQAFIPLFVAIDPVGLAAVFLALSHDALPSVRHRIAWQATATGGLVAVGFLLLGRNVFAAVGISASDFQIAGGLILFILAARDLTQPEGAPAKLPEDFGIVPLGMPLIAGPALITTLLLLVQTQGMRVTVAALAVNLGIVALAFVGSEWLGRRVGETGLRAISKIISMLLAAIAVAMIRRGLAG